ncbi:MAG: hypothetical protein J0L82_05965 [Deltaproteobacteria bacterium]|nr:hypothetical protein [Deltaproteobacteria bacterium]
MLRISKPILSLFVVGLVYGYCLIYSTNSIHEALVSNTATILYIAITGVLSLTYAFKLKIERLRNSIFVCLAGVAGPLGILIASHSMGYAEKMFWVADSINTHHPGALFFFSFISGESQLPIQSLWENLTPGAVTHAWVALWYLLVEPSAVVSTIALVFLKFVTGLILIKLLKEFFDRFCEPPGSSAYLATAIFFWVPTVTFHTIVLYKEAMVHLAFTCVLLCIFRLLKRQHLGSIGLLILSISVLLIERFYVAATLLPLLLFVSWQALSRRNILLSVLVVGVIIGVVSLYGAEISPLELMAKIKQQRLYHASFSDVSFKFNYEIPYIVALGKALFTPIWSPDKIKMFTGLSTLVTWGAFVHYFVVLTYLVGSYRLARRGSTFQMLILQSPLLIFLLFAAYISPWAGRVRDSYYPLFVIFAATYWGLMIQFSINCIKIKLQQSDPTRIG